MSAHCFLITKLSPQSFTQPIEESFFLWFDGCAQALSQFLKQLALFLSQFCRHNDIEDHQLIAAATAPKMRYTFAFYVKNLARLGASRNLQFLIALQSRHVHLCAQHSLSHIDIQIQDNIILAAFEKLMRA